MLSLPHSVSNSRSSSECAFTLLELLTVIATIGILAAIIIPTIAHVRDSARAAQCASNIRQIAQACLLYAESNNGILPPTYKTPLEDGNESSSAWWWAIYPDYISDKDVFLCPADTTTQSSSFKQTYTHNGNTLANGTVSYGSPGEHIYKPLGKSIASFSYPTRTAMFIDYMVNDRRLSENWNSDKPRYFSSSPKARSPFNGEYPAFPHAGDSKTHIVFLDGHVTSITQSDLNTALAERRFYIGTVPAP